MPAKSPHVTVLPIRSYSVEYHFAATEKERAHRKAVKANHNDRFNVKQVKCCHPVPPISIPYIASPSIPPAIKMAAADTMRMQDPRCTRNFQSIYHNPRYE